MSFSPSMRQRVRPLRLHRHRVARARRAARAPLRSLRAARAAPARSFRCRPRATNRENRTPRRPRFASARPTRRSPLHGVHGAATAQPLVRRMLPLLAVRHHQQVAEHDALGGCWARPSPAPNILGHEDLAPQMVEREPATHDHAVLFGRILLVFGRSLDLEPGDDAGRVQRAVEHTAHAEVVALLGTEIGRGQALAVEVVQALERGSSAGFALMCVAPFQI